MKFRITMIFHIAISTKFHIMAADFISGWANSEDSLRPLTFEHAAQALW